MEYSILWKVVTGLKYSSKLYTCHIFQICTGVYCFFRGTVTPLKYTTRVSPVSWMASYTESNILFSVMVLLHHFNEVPVLCILWQEFCKMPESFRNLASHNMVKKITKIETFNELSTCQKPLSLFSLTFTSLFLDSMFKELEFCTINGAYMLCNIRVSTGHEAPP